MALSKTSLEELAVLGGPALFAGELHVGRPNIGDRARLMARIEAMLDSLWLTNDGPLVAEFEATLARRHDVRHCVATNNATSGLQIAIKALGMTGEVILPSFTFVATAHALRWLGLTPIFCDVDPATHLLDPAQVERLITPRTGGILGVHLWGQACAPEALSEIARKHRLPLLFDAAHALGCLHHGQPVGGAGDAEVLSFHATKVANSFEGGAVLTNDGDLASHLRRMRNFGFRGTDHVDTLGINAKMPEVCAAMGLTSLETLDDFIAVNRRNFALYRAGLAGLPGITLHEAPEGDEVNHHYVVLEVDAAQAGLSRDDLVLWLRAEGVLARRYFHPGCHRMAPYRTEDPLAPARLPVTERLSAEVLALPTGTAVTEQSVQAICALIHFLIAESAAIHGRVAGAGSTRAA